MSELWERSFCKHDIFNVEEMTEFLEYIVNSAGKKYEIEIEALPNFKILDCSGVDFLPLITSSDGDEIERFQIHARLKTLTTNGHSYPTDGTLFSPIVRCYMPGKNLTMSDVNIIVNIWRWIVEHWVDDLSDDWGVATEQAIIKFFEWQFGVAREA